MPSQEEIDMSSQRGQGLPKDYGVIVKSAKPAEMQNHQGKQLKEPTNLEV
jgi:hypothetical protein